jgi:hypothetical protein
MRDSPFLVRRLGWHQNPYGDNYTRRLPCAEVTARHATFEDADADRRRRERATRNGENPFRFGGAALFFQTSLDAPRLHDWLLDGGIDPPAEQLAHRSWREWWDAFAHTWTDEQLGHAWQGLNKVRFFDVVEETQFDTIQVLMRMRQGYGVTRVHDLDQQSGSLQAVYRSSVAAQQACDLRNLNLYGEARLQRIRASGGRLVFGVQEIPGDAEIEGNEGFLLQRRAFDSEGRAFHDVEGRDVGVRAPQRLFATRSAANASRDEHIAAAREVLNPFQVFTPLMAGFAASEFVAEVDRINAPLPCPTTLRPELWREWWDLCQDELTDEQRLAAWKLFEDQPLFEALRVEIGGNPP